MIFKVHDTFKEYSGIYKISNSIDERIYIGSTINFYSRYSDHKSALINSKHANAHLQSFANKYGLPCLVFEMMYPCKRECLLFNESALIAKHKALENGFNLKNLIERKHYKDVEKFSFDDLVNAIKEADEKIKKICPGIFG